MVFAAIAALLLQLETLPLQPAEQQLISQAIADFRAHPPGQILQFRDVRLGVMKHSEGTLRPLLCGQVQSRGADGGAEWIAFATLDTSDGYEQWLGASARAWCNERTELDGSRDLSGQLETMLVPKK